MIAVTFVRSDATPMPHSSDKTTLPKAMTIDTMTTNQIRPNRMHVWFNPLYDGIHDQGLDLEAIRTGRSHNQNAQDHGHQLHKPIGRSTTQGRLPTSVPCPRKLVGDDERHGGDHIAQDGWRTTTVPIVPPRPTQ